MAMKRSHDQGERSAEGGELRGSPRMGVAIIGVTFQNKAVTYYDVNGMAIVEGDIALGHVADLEAAMDWAARSSGRSGRRARCGHYGRPRRWPNCRIPHEIDPNLPNQQRVTDAIAHWESRTEFRFPLRTAADSNYVRFISGDGCWSMVDSNANKRSASALGALLEARFTRSATQLDFGMNRVGRIGTCLSRSSGKTYNTGWRLSSISTSPTVTIWTRTTTHRSCITRDGRSLRTIRIRLHRLIQTRRSANATCCPAATLPQSGDVPQL